MTEHDILEKLNKTPLRSKKFLAYLLSSLFITGLLALLIIMQTITLPVAILGSVLALGLTFMSVGYVLSVTALDKLVGGIKGLSGIFNKIEESSEEEEE